MYELYDPALIRVFEQLEGYARSRHSNVITVFREMDRNQSGTVDLAEFKTMLNKILGKPLAGQEHNAVMGMLDANQDGKVDYYEFTQAINKYKSVKRRAMSGTAPTATLGPEKLTRLYSYANNVVNTHAYMAPPTPRTVAKTKPLSRAEMYPRPKSVQQAVKEKAFSTKTPNQFWQSCWINKSPGTNKSPAKRKTRTPSSRPSTALSGSVPTLGSRPTFMENTQSSGFSQREKEHLPAYLKLQNGLLSTIHEPPAAPTPIPSERATKTQRQQKARQQLRTPRAPPKLTSREHMLREYNATAYGEYEPLRLVFPEQQKRYLDAGSFQGRNPSKSENAKAKERQNGNQPKKLSQRPKTREPQILKMPAKESESVLFLNNLYMEEPPHGSAQWKTMFRNGNVTFLNVDEAKREK